MSTNILPHLASVVIGLPDAEMGQLVHAIVQGDGFDPEGLQAFLSERIAPYKRPRSHW